MLRLCAVAIVALLAGCTVGPPPADNGEFYNVARSNPFGLAKTFTTNQSLSNVRRAFERNGPRCLAQSVTTSGIAFYNGVGLRESNTSSYRAEVVRGENGVTLNLFNNITTAVANRPDGFIRFIMADARAVSGGTEIRLAGPSMNFDDVYVAIEEWANGQSSRCPEIKI